MTMRVLQLVLATIWLFDGVLQLQPIMFTRQFGRTMLAPGAPGNPRAVAHSITWASRIIANHSVGTDAAFAAIQILLGLGIAWRPTVKAALAASIVWALAVWWFGEGLGGVFTGTAEHGHRWARGGADLRRARRAAVARRRARPAPSSPLGRRGETVGPADLGRAVGRARTAQRGRGQSLAQRACTTWCGASPRANRGGWPRSTTTSQIS